MGRNFEDAGSQQRKWQCFVCGKNHDDPVTFKDHIVMEHEEGREYIKCPCCEYPVRDMRLHFKIKHPSRTMPRNVQMRATVWRDFAPNGKKKKGGGKVTCRTGYFTSKKNGRDVYYRSGLENDFYVKLEEDVDVLAYKAEPFKVPYYYQGKWHDYLPDLKVDFIDGTSEIWEIKPNALADKAQNEYNQNTAKWAAMNDYASNMGWTFIVQTEEALKEYAAKIGKQKVMGRLNESVE